MGARADLLMVAYSGSSTNYKQYPYAFVQVSALAQRRGLHVERLDLSLLDENIGRALLAAAIARHQPRAVGVTLRNVDAMCAGAYFGSGWRSPSNYPILQTQRGIQILREQTSAPIIIGGCGFTVDPLAFADFLGVDYGIVGEPDGFLDAFNDVLERKNLDQVPNLIYRDEHGVLTESAVRRSYPPLDEPEYTDKIFDEILAFHGHEKFYVAQWLPRSAGNARVPAQGRPSLAVEIVRGCPFSCRFCEEPRIKGRNPQHRSMDAVMADIAMLADRGVRLFWLVCSELNAGKETYILELAQRIGAFSETLSGAPLSWNSFLLPSHYQREELRLLYESGFTGGWTEPMAFNDQHMRELKVPMRVDSVMQNYVDTKEISEELGVAQGYKSIFLGAPNVTPEVLKETLNVLDESGVIMNMHCTGHAMRVYREALTDFPCDTKHMISWSLQGPLKEIDYIAPTYLYPAAMVDSLGSPAAAHQFIDYVNNHIFYKEMVHGPFEEGAGRDWVEFLGTELSLEQIALLSDYDIGLGPASPTTPAGELQGLIESPSPERLLRFCTRSSKREDRQVAAFRLVCALMQLHAEEMSKVGLTLDTPVQDSGWPDLTPYRFHERLYRFDRLVDVAKHVRTQLDLGPRAIELTLLRAWLHLHHVKIVPKYRDWLFERPSPASNRASFERHKAKASVD
ncbi:MAG: hypothetical protein H6707_19990 [Deltaproteobacteria bacterium]|nr:hypothetical protein [Deltaproteobacteria bacterium]